MSWQALREQTRIPTRVTDCPIADAIVEFQFETDIPSDAILGLAYPAIVPHFHAAPQRMPVLSIPPEIREADPNLRSQPHYRFEAENRLIHLGPRSLGFSIRSPYPGWNEFFGWIRVICEALDPTPLGKKVNRVAVRYVNAFEFSIWEHLRFKLMADDQPVTSVGQVIQVHFFENDFYTNLQIASSQNITTVREGVPVEFLGSLIDIDTWKMVDVESFSAALQTAEEAHREEKLTFFSILRDDFVHKMNPSYE